MHMGARNSAIEKLVLQSETLAHATALRESLATRDNLKAARIQTVVQG